MSPGAGLRGRRNRREIINYRVNENSKTHGQIPGVVVNPFISYKAPPLPSFPLGTPPPPGPEADSTPPPLRARSRQHPPPPPAGASSALCPRAHNTHCTIELLARSLASYADLPLEKRVRMEAIHSSKEPV